MAITRYFFFFGRQRRALSAPATVRPRSERKRITSVIGLWNMGVLLFVMWRLLGHRRGGRQKRPIRTCVNVSGYGRPGDWDPEGGQPCVMGATPGV